MVMVQLMSVDSVIVAIRDIDVAHAIHRYSTGYIELPFRTAKGAPLGEIAASAGELLDAVIVQIHDVNVA